jgi:putative transposase
VAAFRDRSLAEQEFPYLFVDATYGKARIGGDRRGRGSRVTAQAIVVATGVSADGRREVLGFDVGDSESGAFWTQFLRGLKARSLRGVQLVISDAHTGLKAAVGSVLLGGELATLPGALPAQRARQPCPRAAPTWSPPRCAPSSPNPTRPVCAPNSR